MDDLIAIPIEELQQLLNPVGFYKVTVGFTNPNFAFNEESFVVDARKTFHVS